MDLLTILILIVLAGICGAIAEFIVGFSPGGIFVTVIVGVVGAFIGNAIGEAIYGIFPILFIAIQVGNVILDLFWATLGSLVLLLLLSLLRDVRRRRLLNQVRS